MWFYIAWLSKKKKKCCPPQYLTHAYWTLSSWSCVLIRLLESWLISLCCSLWLSISLFFTEASSLSDDCSNKRRSRISLLRTERSAKRTVANFSHRWLKSKVLTFLKMSTSSCNQQKHHRLTFCSLLFRLKALLQVVNSFLQTELIFIPVISFSRKLLYNSVNNQEINLKRTFSNFSCKLNISTSSLQSDSWVITATCSSSLEISCSILLFFRSSSFNCAWMRLAWSWWQIRKSLTQ